MKIINNRVNDLNTFGELEAGEVFAYCNNFLMKVVPHDRSEKVDWNAVDLEDGELYWYPDDRVVILLSAELIVS